MHELQFLIVGYFANQILSIMGSQIKIEWIFFYWDSNRVPKMSTWNPKLKSTCINFQKLANHSQLNYETIFKG